MPTDGLTGVWATASESDRHAAMIEKRWGISTVSLCCRKLSRCPTTPWCTWMCGEQAHPVLGVPLSEHAVQDGLIQPIMEDGCVSQVKHDALLHSCELVEFAEAKALFVCVDELFLCLQSKWGLSTPSSKLDATLNWPFATLLAVHMSRQFLSWQCL